MIHFIVYLNADKYRLADSRFAPGLCCLGTGKRFHMRKPLLLTKPKIMIMLVPARKTATYMISNIAYYVLVILQWRQCSKPMLI
jgi:hypothetical protein